jgi:transcriptional regulator with XRE-family HTH domain
VTKSVEVPVFPAVLKWARETSGTTIEDAATRLGVSPSTFARMEKAESTVRLTDLRKLAEYFKRPLSAFLLSSPPAEPNLPTDFRVLHRQSALANTAGTSRRWCWRLADATQSAMRR